MPLRIRNRYEVLIYPLGSVMSLIAILCYGSSVSAEPPAPRAVTPTAILAEIKAKGAHDVVAELFAPSGKWDDLMKQIARGSSDWLNVAVALRGGTDAGSGEALSEAVFMALKPAPAAVLQLLNQERFDFESVCSAVGANDYSVHDSMRFIRERIRTVATVSDPRLKKTRERCVRQLRAALHELSQQNS